MAHTQFPSYAGQYHDRLVHETHQRIPRVGQRDAVADAGAVQLLALTQCAQ